MQLSLSLALIALGDEAVEPVLQRALASDDPGVHAAYERGWSEVKNGELLKDCRKRRLRSVRNKGRRLQRG
jgi:hypothetical protein